MLKKTITSLTSRSQVYGSIFLSHYTPLMRIYDRILLSKLFLSKRVRSHASITFRLRHKGMRYNHILGSSVCYKLLCINMYNAYFARTSARTRSMKSETQFCAFNQDAEGSTAVGFLSPRLSQSLILFNG